MVADSNTSEPQVIAYDQRLAKIVVAAIKELPISPNVLTALGMYGVRKDEEAQGRAAQSDVVGDAGEQNGESNNEKTEIDAGAGGEQKKSN